MVTQKFDLNMIPGKPKPIIRASQYDTGLRAFEVSLFAGTDTYTIPSGATLTVQGTKPDYTGFSYSATYSGNTVTFDCTDQMTACAGAVEMEIAVVNEGKRVATANFVLQVEPAALKDDTIISETDIPIIEQLPEMMEDVNTLISTFGGPNVAETAAEMTDQDKVYVYIGSETGYNSGHWYYYDKTAHVWKDGGIYQSAGVEVDNTLSIGGMAADAKATGDALALKADIASPTFTGDPKAPTASLISYNTQIANTEFVQRLVLPLDDAVNGLEPTEIEMHLVVDGTTGTWAQGGKTNIYDLLPGDNVEVTAGERDAYLVWYTTQGGSEAVNVSTSHTVTAGATGRWGTTDARKLAVLMEDTSGNDVSPASFTINGVEKGLNERVDALETTKQDTLTFDTTPTEGSTNPVTSGGAWEAVQTDKTLAVEDKAADAKATGDALGTKQDTLTFDSTPTENSTNPVTSGGVWDAVEDVSTELEGKIDTKIGFVNHGEDTMFETGHAVYNSPGLAATRRWFVNHIFAAGTHIKSVTFGATANSASRNRIQYFEVWEKNNDTLTKAKTVSVSVVQEQASQTVAYFTADMDYTASSECMICVKTTGTPVSMLYTIDPLDRTNVLVSTDVDLSTESLLYSSLEPFNAVKVLPDMQITYDTEKRVNVVLIGPGMDYEEIQDALLAITDDSSSNPYTLLVMPKGTPYKPFTMLRNSFADNYPWSGIAPRHISIIGLDKEHCIIRSDSGDYKYPCGEPLTNGIIKNLSFVMTQDEQTETATQGGYCLHIDSRPLDDAGYKMLIEDCDFSNESGPCLGIGVHANCDLQIRRCRFTTTLDADYMPHDGYRNLYDYGVVYCHTSTATPAPNQLLTLEDCVGVCAEGERSLRIDKTTQYDPEVSSFVYTLLRNVFWNKAIGTPGYKIGGALTANPMNYGNND